MHLYLAAIVSGIAVGGTYALIAVGITQIFSVTRVLNFAHAGFMMWGAYIYGLTSFEHHWPVGLAAIFTVAVVGLMGLVAELIVFRFAHRATTVNKIIMTFGMLNFMTALATMIFDRDTKAAVALMPRGGFRIFDTSVSWQQVCNLLAVVAVVLLMTLFLQRTRLGLLTRAMAEDLTITELMGTNRNKIGMINWTMSAMVGGLAGVLAASLQPFALPQFTAYFLFALVATLLGGLRSLTWTAVGGVLLGVITSVSTVASSTVGIGTLAIFLTVVALVLLRRKWPTELAKIGWTKPQLSKGDKMWWLNRTLLVVGWAWVIVAVHRSDVWGTTGASILVYSVAAFSLIPLVGWTGQISLAQGGFMAIGAAAFAEANTYHHLNLALSLIIGLFFGALAGTLVGLICYRLSFVQTAIITLGFTGVIVGWFVYSPYTHLKQGRVSVNVPNFLDTGRSAFVGFAVLALLVGMVLLNIRRSQWGIAFISVRTAPDMSRHFGLRPAVVRVVAFSLSGTIAAVAGIMYVEMVSIVDSSSFGIGFSLQVLILAVLGGTSMLWGPFIGPLAFFAIPQALNLSRFGGSGWPDLLGGVGLVQFMATRPDGMLSLMRRPGASSKSRPGAPPPKRAAHLRTRPTPELVAAGIEKHE